ncbi:hypothetical protein ACLOJK_039627 [Asimina triloba]
MSIKIRTEKFLDLASILEPGKPPKVDKAAILSDAVRMVTQLRNEAQKLKESNENLQEKIKELKLYGAKWIFSYMGQNVGWLKKGGDPMRPASWDHP